MYFSESVTLGAQIRLSIYLHTAPNEMRSDTNAITLYPVFFKARATEID